MTINTHRFGPVQIPDDKVIYMERPILGFEHLTTFCLVERDDMSPMMWLQSMEDPAVAFLVVNPRCIYPDYRIEVNPNEIAELRVAKVASVETYVIITMTDDPRQTSVNLQGPVLINTENNLAKQLVLVNSEYTVRHLLFAEPVAERQTERRHKLVTV
ncbi:MAG: flagellar assembly protein FliW [Candidatus Zixiibacteriota bacterium]